MKLNKEVKKSSKMGNLRPLLVFRVLRVGGRLQKAVVLSWDEKHPMVLPKRHHVSQLIVRHYHESAAHSGRELRRIFWIIGGRGLVKKTIRRCIRCRRMNAKPWEQFKGSLPRARSSGATELRNDGDVCSHVSRLALCIWMRRRHSKQIILL